jgi:hypothetical protein
MTARYKDPNTAPLSQPNPQCFLAGTAIDMADGSRKPIEQVKPGDLVMAFDPAASHGRGGLMPIRVTRTFESTSDTIIDLRGLKVTPGHVFPTGEGDFAKLADILRDDRTIVERDGTLVRARTGVKAGTQDDIVVRIEYRDPSTDKLEVVAARAGIPCIRHPSLDAWMTLAWAIDGQGCTILADGRIAGNGEICEISDWPEGSTRFDLEIQRNFSSRTRRDAPMCPSGATALMRRARAYWRS